mmetsp:Transcript_11274/g.27572  ORF Transcript_11274/g.27572 Transcript_11274/m.27572 type:complete len:353 (-) Transcript_11274:351-1409(-)
MFAFTTAAAALPPSRFAACSPCVCVPPLPLGVPRPGATFISPLGEAALFRGDVGDDAAELLLLPFPDVAPPLPLALPPTAAPAPPAAAERDFLFTSSILKAFSSVSSALIFSACVASRSVSVDFCRQTFCSFDFTSKVTVSDFFRCSSSALFAAVNFPHSSSFSRLLPTSSSFRDRKLATRSVSRSVNRFRRSCRIFSSSASPNWSNWVWSRSIFRSSTTRSFFSSSVSSLAVACSSFNRSLSNTYFFRTLENTEIFSRMSFCSVSLAFSALCSSSTSRLISSSCFLQSLSFSCRALRSSTGSLAAEVFGWIAYRLSPSTSARPSLRLTSACMVWMPAISCKTLDCSWPFCA